MPPIKGKDPKPRTIRTPQIVERVRVQFRPSRRERRARTQNYGAHRKRSDILPEQPSVKIKELYQHPRLFPETKTHRDHFPNIVRPAEPEKKMFKNCRKEDLRIVALKLEEDRKKEAENRLREKELELELARLNVNSDNERTGEGCNTLDALVKSVRILTVKVPNRPEERVQMLLGAEVFYELMLPGQFKTEGSNVIFKTHCFPIYRFRGSTSSDAKEKNIVGFIQAADNLEHSIKKFWKSKM
ncbi:hypothetical protein TNCV_2834121 [Trichonephila clavipes]|nr:hypothetical protein TNCV_2834121 [Trichonephila clavipes]